MLSPDIIARIKTVNLRGRKLASDVMTGDYASTFHGRGMEFHEVREYVPGDDVRDIDWNVTARMNTPFVKVFREERELTMMLMVDVSASMSMGSGRARRVAAAELAAALAWIAIKSNDRVGLLLFGEKVELFVPPRKGPSHVWRIIKEVMTWSESSSGTNVSAAVDYLAKVLKRKCVCFVISDFLFDDSRVALSRLSSKHDLTCVVMDCRPLDGLILSGGSGVVHFKDLETGEQFELDTSSQPIRQAIEEHYKMRQNQLANDLRGAGADFFRIVPEHSIVDPLIAYLRERQNSRQKRRAM